MLQRLAFLFLCISYCTTVNTPCASDPSPEFRDLCMECSGPLVKQVPRLLPPSLQVLRLTNTNISFLDNSSFQGCDLPELTTLNVTGGLLSSVGAEAFCSLPALTMLHLNHNQLELVDELSFSCNKFLRTVSLVGNRRFRQLPRLVSWSVQNLYLDNCNLQIVNVITLEGMTGLKVLSLADNPRLHCPSVKTKLLQARPELEVTCEYTAGDLSTSFPDEQERIPEKSLTESASTITFTGVEGSTSEKSLPDSETINANKENNSTKDENRNSEKPSNGSDSTSRYNGKDSTPNAAFYIVPIVALFSVVVILVAVLYHKYRKRNPIQNLPPNDPCQQPFNSDR